MGMGVNTLVSEEEYLRMSFPDRAPEYVDGELVERGVLQQRLPVFPRSELRVPVAPGKYRIVDLAVYTAPEPVEQLPKQTPLIVVEIVSPDDRYEDLMTRLEEFRAWGVPHIWLVDPGLTRMYVFSNGGLTPVLAFELPEFGVQIAAGDILR